MLSISLLSLLLVVLSLVVLGGFTVQTNPRRRANQYFGLVCSFTTLWVIVNYLADSNPDNALLWTRLAFWSATLGIGSFVLFANAFPRRVVRGSWFTLTIATITIAMAVITLLPGFIPEVIYDGTTANVVPGQLYPLFVDYFVTYMLIAFGLLIRAERRERRVVRERVRFVFAGVLLMVSAVSLTNLFLPLVIGENPWARYGSYFTLVFVAFTSYAIVKHRLFNVRAVVARSVAYTLLVLTLAGFYSLAAFTLSQYLFPDSNNGWEQNLAYAALAVSLAITFQPLKSFFERVTDRFLFRDHYDSQELLNDFGQVLVGELKLERLMERSLRLLGQRLKVAHAHLYVFDDNRIYRVAHYGSIPPRLPTVGSLQLLRHRLAVADELEHGKEKEVLETFDIRLSLHVRTKNEFVGYLLLGDKLNGDIFIEQDIEVLEILGKELAVAITNAKAYDEIAHFNATLQQKVDDATHKLRSANARLKELDATKDEFISMASHQLRTPLTSIKGYLSMLVEGDAGRVTKQQKEFIGYAYESSRQMSNLVADMLNVSRMSAGRFVIERTPVDLAKMVEEEVDQLRTHADTKGLKLVWQPPKTKLPLLKLDESKTRQVVMNFIDNAVYYTQAGSVTVTLERRGGAVELRVTDTGIGVPKAAQAKLFSKFYRAGNAQTVRPDGTGLGLFLAKRVVEDQGGTIVFESSEGRGSTFGFVFPIPKTQ